MNITEVLTKSRNQISSPEGWCQFRWNKHKITDEYVPHAKITNPDEIRFCADGATKYFSGNDGSIWHACNQFLFKAALELYKRSHINVNDFLGHQETLKMFDRAIELSKSVTPDVS